MLVLDRAVSVAAFICVGIIIGVVMLRLAPVHAADPCWEDEAALWDGSAHTVCVPLDDMIGEGQ